MPYFGQVTVATPPEAPAVECRSFDISLGGVGLVWPATPGPRPGGAVALTFHLAASAVPERVYGRVAWTRRGRLLHGGRRVPRAARAGVLPAALPAGRAALTCRDARSHHAGLTLTYHGTTAEGLET